MFGEVPATGVDDGGIPARPVQASRSNANRGVRVAVNSHRVQSYRGDVMDGSFARSAFPWDHQQICGIVG